MARLAAELDKMGYRRCSRMRRRPWRPLASRRRGASKGISRRCSKCCDGARGGSGQNQAEGRRPASRVPSELAVAAPSRAREEDGEDNRELVRLCTLGLRRVGWIWFGEPGRGGVAGRSWWGGMVELRWHHGCATPSTPGSRSSSPIEGIPVRRRKRLWCFLPCSHSSSMVREVPQAFIDFTSIHQVPHSMQSI